MSYAAEALGIFLIVASYSTFGFGNAMLANNLLLDERDQGTRHPGPFFAGIFWPVALPVLIPFYLHAVRDKIKLPTLRRSPEQKVLAYAETPALVMAQIVAQRIIAYPQGLAYREWSSEDGKIKISFLCGDEAKVQTLAVNGRNFIRSDLEGKPAKIVDEALRKAIKFKREKAQSDAEAAARMKALEAVESLLLQPEKDND